MKMKLGAWLFFDIVIIAFGIYELVINIRMQKSGKINKGIRNRSNLMGRPCRDERAYVDSITKPGKILGIVAIATGVYAVICDVTGFLPIIRMLFTLAFLGVAWWYFKSVSNASKTYF